MKDRITKLNTAISILFLVSSANILAAEELIKNGSFENYSVHKDDVKSKQVEFEHWQGIGEVWDKNTGKPAIEGSHKIELDAGNELNSLSQTVTTVAGKNYQVSVQAYAKKHRSSDFEILVDDQLIATIKPNGQWSEYRAYFIGSGKDQLISLKELDHQNNSFGAVIDYISLQESPELIVNGSFEDFTTNKDYGKWKLVDFTGWDGAGEAWDTRLGRQPTLGAYKIELDAGRELNSLVQSVKTEKDVEYIFSLDAYSNKWRSSDFEIWVDGKKIANVSPTSLWKRYAYRFIGNGQKQRIELRELDSQNDTHGAVIDHVSLVRTKSPTVKVTPPEKTLTLVKETISHQHLAVTPPSVSTVKTTSIAVINKNPSEMGQKMTSNIQPKATYIIDIAKKFGKATQPKKGGYKLYEPADKAIDGDESTYNHTQGLETKNWWQLELPNPTKISRIMLQGRNRYQWRLYGAKVYISDTPYNGTLNANDRVATLKGNSDKQWIKFATPKSGSYLIIKGRERRPLHLAIVEVYGQTPEQPAFNAHKNEYLIDGKTSIGKIIATINATDFQDDSLTYSIVENAPFSIDNQGVIKVEGDLLGKYNLTIKANDGQRVTRTSISITATSTSAVDEALTSGRVDSVTEEELVLATLSEIEAGQHQDVLPHALANIKTLFTHFLNHDFSFDWSQCDGEKCDQVLGLKYEFEDGAKAVKEMVDTLDINKTNIFNESGYRLQKLLVLTADKFRQQVQYPMDKVLTDDTEFMQSYYADHVIYNYRRINPAQADMGNFSRSHFSHITPVTKIVNIESKKDFRSTGAYALPGETVSITRHDSSDLTVNIFINSLRHKATHQYEEEGYNRPKYLQTPHIEIKSGETIELTSPYGGPIQLEFSKSHQPILMTFDHVGEHPYWNGEEDNASFKKSLAKGDYDWAEIATPIFEIHSTLEKMRQSINNPAWGSAEALAKATVRYLHDIPHALAGYQGTGISPIAELHDFADMHGWTIDTLDEVKHMNADQASCSTGCAGNPYDASWAYNPVGLGDIHELSHGLQGKKRFKEWSGHSMTNYYAYYSQYQYYQDTGQRLSCQKLPFKESFMVLQASMNESDPATYVKENLWSNNKWNKGTAMFIQMMMAVQHDGALDDGWLLRGRLHLFEREFDRALSNKVIWNKKRDSLGMSLYNLKEARSIDNNDWHLLALSYTTERDFRDYLDLWAISFSDKADLQVKSLGYSVLPPLYFKSKKKAYCKGLKQPTITLDGQQVW